MSIFTYIFFPHSVLSLKFINNYEVNRLTYNEADKKN